MRALVLCSILLLTACAQDRQRARWWKGNTHTHTLWSDGDAAPEHVIDWYAGRGYHFLVLSDHNVLSRGERWFPVAPDGTGRLRAGDVEELRQRFGDEWVETRERGGVTEMRLRTLPELRARFEAPGRFILIEGEEVTDRFERSEIHVNALNIAEAIAPQHGESIRDTIQRNIDAIIAHGREHGRPVLAHLNHPNFRHSLTPEDVASIRGERFFEVYNGHRGVLNHGDETTLSTEAIWDVALALRLTTLDLGVLYGLATDDAHDHTGRGAVSTPGRGWVQVRAGELTPEHIITALRAGDFYSSTGVTLRDFGLDGGALWLEIDAEPGVTYTTEFIGLRLENGQPVRVGEVLAVSTQTRPAFRLTDDVVYVRARVTSSVPHPNPFAEGDMEMAWVQPVTGPAAGVVGVVGVARGN